MKYTVDITETFDGCAEKYITDVIFAGERQEWSFLTKLMSFVGLTEEEVIERANWKLFGQLDKMVPGNWCRYLLTSTKDILSGIWTTHVTFDMYADGCSLAVKIQSSKKLDEKIALEKAARLIVARINQLNGRFV